MPPRKKQNEPFTKRPGLRSDYKEVERHSDSTEQDNEQYEIPPPPSDPSIVNIDQDNQPVLEEAAGIVYTDRVLEHDSTTNTDIVDRTVHADPDESTIQNSGSIDLHKF